MDSGAARIHLFGGRPMMARKVVHHVVDLPTSGSSTLRLALVNDGEAGPTLILAHGFGEGPDFYRPGFCGTPITLSADLLPELRRALDALGTDDGA